MKTTVLRHDDCELHNQGHNLIRDIERLIYNETEQPRFDVILTHAAGDTHKDHVVAFESTISAARRFHGTIFLYQAPSTIVAQFRPSVFVELCESAWEAKSAALREHKSQKDKPFMKGRWLAGVAGSWGNLHWEEGTKYEAFEVYRSFWGHGT